MATEKKIFIKITNEDIYNKLENLSKELIDFKITNEEQHNMIISSHFNDKRAISVLKWISGAALTIAVFLATAHITNTI